MPAIVVWIIGVLSSLLFHPACGKVLGCAPAIRFRVVGILGSIAAVVHVCILIVEILVVWISTAFGSPDGVAILLVVKNVLCLVTEATLATLSCNAKNHAESQLPPAQHPAAQIQMSSETAAAHLTGLATATPTAIGIAIGQPVLASFAHEPPVPGARAHER